MARLRGRFLRASLAASVLWAAVAGGSVAHAFSEPRSYFDDPKAGGGGGRWFTGSPAEGYDCSVCHSGQAPQPLYIAGLPDTGYVPGASYDVHLYWPEFAQLAHALRQTPGNEPSMGVVAEFVAENGEASGTIEIATEGALPSELCEVPMGQRAAHLYTVRPAKEAVEATHCSATDRGQRCLITVLGCGAAELHVHWTPPREAQGPIWFSAGFVATQQLSGNPQNDAVNDFARVLMPAGSDGARYVNKLDGQCSIGMGQVATLPVGMTASCACLLLARARRRKPARSA